MKKSWLEFYALTVCFGTLIGLVVTSTIMIHSLIGITNPEVFIPSHKYEKFSSNEAYLEDKSNDYYIRCDTEKTNHCKETNPYTRMTAADAAKLRKEDKKSAIDMARRDHVQTWIDASIVLLIAVLVLTVHICIVKRERKNYAYFN